MSTVDAHNPDLDQIPVLVHERLTRFLDARAAEVAAIGTPVTEAVEYLRNFVLNGGKRIRPLYVWAGFVAAQGPDESAENIESVLDAAAHFGQSVAILAGDMALVWAEDMLQDSGLSAEALARTRDAWRGMRTEVIGGQLLDIFLEAQANESVDLADSVNRFKTAAYTIERPLHLGASIAGADDELITALRNYGRDIGIAFQLRDDLLGVFGDPAITGKPAGDDIREGKRTVLLSLALQQADISDPDASAVIRAGIGKVSDPVEISRIAGLIRETGAEDQVEQRITALTESGLAHLDIDSIPEGVRKQLRHLAIRATERRM